MDFKIEARVWTDADSAHKFLRMIDGDADGNQIPRDRGIGSSSGPAPKHVEDFSSAKGEIDRVGNAGDTQDRQKGGDQEGDDQESGTGVGSEEGGNQEGSASVGVQESRESSIGTDRLNKEGFGPLYRPTDWDRCANSGTGREHWRGESQRDYARVVHCPSFRRLQGKTQLFPGHESDFFRNRLTHSLEVAQIAESIAYRLNATEPYFKAQPLDPRVCAIAGLIHDLGHPPFGHNGEHALDDKMRRFGGFEGNAQTLRIVSRLEKKARHQGSERIDNRAGLDLTYRVLASCLKYDEEIPYERDDNRGLIKGYYKDDVDIVRDIKRAVVPGWDKKNGFKTIECSIMDLADDIAYSTYDLEDSLKANFLTPASILSSSAELLARVAKKVEKATGHRDITGDRILEVFFDLFSGLATGGDGTGEFVDQAEPIDLFRIVRAFENSRQLATDGYFRTILTSELVGEFINKVQVNIDFERPSLSKVHLDSEALLKVETLKNFTFEATIFSTRLKVAEFRGYEVVSGIFDALAGPKGHLLMPDDVREMYLESEHNSTATRRIICDFVAGMTDRYALEFYARLHSDNPQSIFKPI